MNIEVKDLTVRYGFHKALDRVSHVFDEGRMHVLLGPNGCGKTTLIKKIVEKYAHTSQIAYVSQELFGNVALSVYDTVALGRYDKSRFLGGLTDEDRAKVEYALELMGLKELEDRIFDTLSGGEKQRCMVARAIAQDTEWTLLDEPSSSLDVKYSKLIMNIFEELREKGKSFIIVLHDINTASRYGDGFVLMKDGKIAYEQDELTVRSLEDVFETPFGEGSSSTGKKIFYPL